MTDNSEELLNLRKFLKERLQRDFTTLRGHENERENVRQLLQRTAEMGESNSLLLIGPRGSGKTTLINAVLTDLMKNKDFISNTLIVQLNGNLHTDDRLALKSATIQMQWKMPQMVKYSCFAENLAFLLACLKAGNRKSKSVVFILKNLICFPSQPDLLCQVTFFHRQIFLFPDADNFKGYLKLFADLLTIPSEKELKEQAARVATLKNLNSQELTFHRNHFNPARYKFNEKFALNWNKHIQSVVKQASVSKSLQSIYDFDVSESLLKLFIFRLVAQIRPNNRLESQITAEQIQQLAASYEVDDKVELLCGLSVLELCLIIAIKHHSEIYDRDPFNFEIIFSRFSKFAKVSSTMQGLERCVVLKAFEHLRNVELLLPLTSTGCKVQKEFEMHKLALTYSQINQAVQRYQALPTEVQQWSISSLI
ncbi:hypothetical protein DOY81_008299 [Sarcophaga bullata]|nr:hypothetical protein DOY81_008299 [Sarcophaga bullata]